VRSPRDVAGAPGPGRARTIVHVDMDAFYVACEVLRRPELAGRAVIVGGTGNRGVVAAASYEARRYGIHSAMPSARARRLCPHAVVLPGDHAYYAETSRAVHAVLADYTPLIEPIALDEAFLDVTGAGRLFGPGREIAWTIRVRVAAELGLACSVGVASSKLVAKLASEAAKPVAGPGGVTEGEGVVEVLPGEELAFVHPLPVQALWGVGPSTLARLRRLGVVTVGDLAAVPGDALVAVLGRANGVHLHELASGRDDRPVVAGRAPKSIGHEETFARDVEERGVLEREVARLADAVAGRLRAQELSGRTVTVKVRFGDFHTITRATTLPEPVSNGPAIAAVARELLAGIDPAPGVRLLGVSLTALAGRPVRQLTLDGVTGGPDPTSWDEASRTVDDIRRRFGDEAIGPAARVQDGRVRAVRPGAQQWGPDDDP